MEAFYYAIVVILFLLAVSDLVVGVSNDAVNFLNSAVGSRVAPFRFIMLVAAFGVLVGATFSSGMMEIARKGIFNPDQFVFAEVMIIFLAVMLTDVIILDSFNTLGLPTSTTVSLIFELLGASVAVSLVKISHAGMSIAELANYINSSKALAIIAGILLSVIIAFTVGTLIMYLSRLLFTFNYKRNLRYFGGVFGSLAITAITYFILIKGAKDSAFISGNANAFIENNTMNIMLLSFVGWSIILQFLIWFRINVLRIVVLVGTFALAMAFAGNDLVNFIGVPLAGYESFKVWLSSGGADPENMGMGMLSGAVKTPVIFLLISGIIMVVTLWTSRKARTVLETSIDLSRQAEGDEKFGSSFLARAIVKAGMNIGAGLSGLFPGRIKKFFSRRLDLKAAESKSHGQAGIAFDQVRAAVNLLVASSLIAMGTSLKLPLSTTYVTFMVAMGTSFADQAWGRESAVYRITGVLSVIGGWFITALAAFTIAFIVAVIISYGGFIAISGLILLALFFVYRTHVIHKRKDNLKTKKSEIEATKEMQDESVVAKCNSSIITTLTTVASVYGDILASLNAYDIKTLKKNQQRITALNQEAKSLKSNMMITLMKLKEDSIETSHYYVQILDYLREIAHCVNFISVPAIEHVSNHHKEFIEAQKDEVSDLNRLMQELFSHSLEIIKEKKYSQLDKVFSAQQSLLAEIETLRKNQVRRLKTEMVSTKNSLLYLNILQESKNLSLFTVNMLKSHRDFFQPRAAADV